MAGLIRVYNNSKQLLSLQVKPPGGEFYSSEQQVRLLPGQDCLLPKSYIMSEQIENLRARGVIKVVYDDCDE